ncbi:MAG: exopolysaccharide biosynthesis polyprenyl glycosylphosphotransferase [Candidatus Marinimicrobia bacterium]|nr:exopolysaccharide biosynthesis polyprenyl glycosylphosphotransferase [Candidatus Neomarinimicrobiota bacterium]
MLIQYSVIVSTAFIISFLLSWKKEGKWQQILSNSSILIATSVALGLSIFLLPEVAFKVPTKYLMLGLVFIITSIFGLNSKILENKKIKISLFVWTSIGIAVLGRPFYSIYFPQMDIINIRYFSYPIISLWLLMISYSIDVFDNIKGLSGGITSIILITTSFIALQTGQTLITLLNLVILGSMLGYLKFDFFNSQLGRVNKFLIGFSVGFLTLEVARIGESTCFHAIFPLAIATIPIIESVLSMFRKMKYKENIFIHDEHQLHNRIVALNFSHKVANSILFIFSFVFGGIAVLYKYLTDDTMVALVSVSFLLVFLLIYKLGYMQMDKNLIVLDEKSKTKDNRGYQVAPFNIHRTLQKMLFLLGDVIFISATMTLVRFLEIRFGVPSEQITSMKIHIIWCIWSSIFWCGLIGLNDLYDIAWDASRIDEVFSIFKIIVFGAFVIFLINIFLPVPILITKGIFLIYLSLLFAGISIGRMLLISFLRHNNLLEFNYRKTLIIGSGAEARSIIKNIRRIPVLKFNPIGIIPDEADENAESVNDLKVLGKLEGLSEILTKYKIEEVIIAAENRDPDEILNMIAKIDQYKISIKLIPDYYEILSGYRTSHIYGISLVRFVTSTMKTWEWIVKRMIDTLFSLFVIVGFMPVWLAIAVMIKMDSSGPVLYTQVRSGRNKKEFKIFKFRSMTKDAEKGGAQWAQKNDMRITKVGAFLRKSGIDEVPQFLNVLIGDMSVVGPRPERPVFIQDLEKQVEFYSRRLLVKPGITGWAQLKYKYDESIEDVKQKVKDDLYYIRNMSVGFDIKIMVQTALTVFEKWKLHH